MHIKKYLRTLLTSQNILPIFLNKIALNPKKPRIVSIFKKIAIGWGVVIVLYFVALYVLPHKEVGIPTKLNHVFQALLFCLNFYLFRREPTKANKFIFFNFFVLFSISVINFISDFFGIAFFSQNPFANFVFWQFSTIAFFFFLSLSIVYLVIDSLFHELKTVWKYSTALILLLLFFAYYFFPVFKDPMSAYKAEEIKQWKSLDAHITQSPEAAEILMSGDRERLAMELSSNVKLQSWKDGIAVGDLYPDQNYNRIQALLPFLEGENYQILIVRPMYIDLVQINILLVVLILVFFGYQYTKDPPQGAYIDKIMFVFLLLCSMEILHNWAFIKSLEWSTWDDVFTVGQYVTVFIEMVMVFFFGLRLNFITSAQGEFYETELASHPAQITRWRDWVDDMILSHFFNFKVFNGRMFQDPSKK